MNIVIFSYPEFFGEKKLPAFASIPRFTNMLANGMMAKGHNVVIWSPIPQLFNLPVYGRLKKWLGYIDQYILFPKQVQKQLKSCNKDTLFVFTDHAQGLWVNLVSDRNHVIHCHDFLAQNSALGKIKENPISWSGRFYQRIIRNGYLRGKHFISVSEETKTELHKFLKSPPLSSNVVYNGINIFRSKYDCESARIHLEKEICLNLKSGYILHVGGNQWYKNRLGVIEIYNSWRNLFNVNLPLLLIGDALSEDLNKVFEKSPYKDDIYAISGLEDAIVHLAYLGASVFLFPSLNEGFGWPIAEAMVNGCLVITTNEAPMTTVAGHAGFFIDRRPVNSLEVETWANNSAEVVNKVILLTNSERDAAVKLGFENVKKFDLTMTLDTIEKIYKTIVSTKSNS